ncbi:MAG: hypothetical protein JWO89_3109 [Verrucomicrobiaceae bacterium]|nr:hypothetical protein [Verrucomicrobiaceae bacterium]
MEEKDNAVQGKMDPVETRAAEIAQREGRTTVTNDDRRVAFEELGEMGPPANHETVDDR